MRVLLKAALLLSILAPTTALAELQCRTWLKLSPEQKASRVEGMISGHLSNQKSKHFTSENRVAMRRCLRGYVPRIIDDIDDACYDSRKGGLGAVDDVFDRYLLSCVR